MKKASAAEHYSYRVYADRATAQNFDQRRFGGPIGRLVADDQAQALAAFVAPSRDRSVLDVGTGTGRAALLLAREGAKVTGIDASEEMLAIARGRAAEERLPIRFLPGDAHCLQFADRSFDVVVSLRVLMHAPDWRMCLAELCRVANDAIVVDYPSASSFAAVEAGARRILHALGRATEPYRVLTGRAMARELGQRGFEVRAVHRQFVLPIAVHKAIASVTFSRGSRRLSERLGLLRLLGSPVTLVAHRCAS